MKSLLTKKSVLHGEITIPPSKSHTLRAILFASLAEGTSIIHGYLPSPDTKAMITACRLMGASIEMHDDHLNIQGVNGQITHTEDVIYAGNSGIVLRFCASVGALSSYPIVITGDHSIRHHRHMAPLLEGLSQLGVSVKSMRGDGFAPVIIQGPLQSGKATIRGEDSQYVSALLIASAFTTGCTHIDVLNPGEKPWVNLTLDWFDKLGISYENNDFKHYLIKGSARYKGFEYRVPGDLSSAAFPIAAALVTNSDLTLRNVDMKDIQGDKELIYVLQKMGANFVIDEIHKTLFVKQGSTLRGISVDINPFIDGITILAVLACFAKGTTHIYNGAIAKQKECNRIHCIASQLRKMGGNIQETDDGLIIKESPLHGSSVFSHHDHRMTISLAIAGMGADGETLIEAIDCVSKTYPSFISDFKVIGASIEEVS